MTPLILQHTFYAALLCNISVALWHQSRTYTHHTCLVWSGLVGSGPFLVWSRLVWRWLPIAHHLSTRAARLSPIVRRPLPVAHRPSLFGGRPSSFGRRSLIHHTSNHITDRLRKSTKNTCEFTNTLEIQNGDRDSMGINTRTQILPQPRPAEYTLLSGPADTSSIEVGLI